MFLYCISRLIDVKPRVPRYMVLDAGVVPAQGAAIQEIGLAKLHWDAVQQHQLLSANILRTHLRHLCSVPHLEPPKHLKSS